MISSSLTKNTSSLTTTLNNIKDLSLNLLNIFPFLLLSLILNHCSSIKKKTKPFFNAPYQFESCSDFYSPRNYNYPTTKYAGTFLFDTKQYKTIIIGDSTMDFIRKIEDYHSESTQNVAVAGNTLCDMIEQLPSINTYYPEAIVISTGGGNDAIRKISNKMIVQTGKELIKHLRKKFPKTKIVLAGIHPTSLDYVNSNRKEINQELKTSVDCYVDPDPIFNIDKNGFPERGALIDEIHYSIEKSLSIKKEFEKCGVKF
jgi:hypothetical protein